MEVYAHHCAVLPSNNLQGLKFAWDKRPVSWQRGQNGKFGLVQICCVWSVYVGHAGARAACQYLILVMFVCVQQERAWPIWYEKGKDVISIGKCYRLRGLFMVISHTHTHTHANTQSNLFTPKFEHTPGQEHLHTLTIVRGLSDNLVMVHREQFDG